MKYNKLLLFCIYYFFILSAIKMQISNLNEFQKNLKKSNQNFS